MISASDLAKALVEHLPRQRWFSGREAAASDVTVQLVDVLRPGPPALLHVLAEAGTATYQLVVGERLVSDEAAVLEGRGDALIGVLNDDGDEVILYDALVDSELALALLEVVAPDEEAERARLLVAEQSNSSVVYDDRLFLKLFRRLPDGPNPDAEVTRALARVGFSHVAAPVAEWRGDGSDYAIVTEFLTGGADGFHLAVASLRDLYARGGDPAEAGGDFAPEATRLGDITGRMHVALAEAFGHAPADVGAWVTDMRAQLARAGDVGVPNHQVEAVYASLATLEDPGPSIRVHGDYHLGQVMRTDRGWFVLDFEGEPARPLEERRRPSSPLKDVAGMLRSFHYAAEVARRERGEEAGETEAELGRQWEERNALSFIDGYFGARGVETVLPEAPADRSLVLDAFLLDKAIYEVGYERSHRPDWIDIPLSAVHRLLEPPP